MCVVVQMRLPPCRPPPPTPSRFQATVMRLQGLWYLGPMRCTNPLWVATCEAWPLKVRNIPLSPFPKAPHTCPLPPAVPLG